MNNSILYLFAFLITLFQVKPSEVKMITLRDFERKVIAAEQQLLKEVTDIMSAEQNARWTAYRVQLKASLKEMFNCEAMKYAPMFSHVFRNMMRRCRDPEFLQFKKHTNKFLIKLSLLESEIIEKKELIMESVKNNYCSNDTVPCYKDPNELLESEFIPISYRLHDLRDYASSSHLKVAATNQVINCFDQNAAREAAEDMLDDEGEEIIDKICF